MPRKGMYALRSSNCDCFTLCDLSTSADYAAIALFALSETMTPVFATPSGDTIQNCLVDPHQFRHRHALVLADPRRLADVL